MKVMRFALVAVAVAAVLLVASFLYYELYHHSRKVPCHRLPAAEEVGRMMDEHEDVKREIEEHAEWVEVDYARCPGKADILIYYGTVDDRTSIKGIIGGNFFGIPYRMYNV